MLRPNLVSFIESEMALPTLSNKLIEKQNLNFLPLRKFENFLEFFQNSSRTNEVNFESKFRRS